MMWWVDDITKTLGLMALYPVRIILECRVMSFGEHLELMGWKRKRIAWGIYELERIDNVERGVR